MTPDTAFKAIHASIEFSSEAVRLAETPFPPAAIRATSIPRKMRERIAAMTAFVDGIEGKEAPATPDGVKLALASALNMLRIFANGEAIDSKDFYPRVVELECALDPTLKPGEALRRFTERQPHRPAPRGWDSVGT